MAEVVAKRRRKTIKMPRVLNIIIKRTIWSAILVFATYNPTGWSIFHLVKDRFAMGTAGMVIVIVLVAIAHILFLTLAGKLGNVAKGCMIAFVAAMVYLAYEKGLFQTGDVNHIVWFGLFVQTIVYTIAISAGHVWRILTGRIATDEGHDDDHDDE